MAALFDELAAATQSHTAHRLLLGVFADREQARLYDLCRQADSAVAWLQQYYGQDIDPRVGLVIGSGQPAVWDIPLLDLNQASLYFMQAPTYSLDRLTLRRILYDHLFQRAADDPLYDTTTAPPEPIPVLGIGHRTDTGWQPEPY